MKYITFLLIIFFTIIPNAAVLGNSCHNNFYLKDYPFNHLTQIPLRYKDKRGCWIRENRLNFIINSLNKANNRLPDVTANIPKSSFENIDLGHQQTYLYIDDQNHNQINFITFICIDQSVVHMEGFSGQYENIVELAEFTCGPLDKHSCAEKLHMKKILLGYRSTIPYVFVNLFKKDSKRDNLEYLNFEIIKIPQINFNNINHQQLFQANDVVDLDVELLNQFGCSNNFAKTMKRHNLNYQGETLIYNDLIIKNRIKKESKLQFIKF